METTVVNGMLTVKVNMLQTVALAVIVYFFGVFVRAKVPVLRRFSIPAPVIGGLTFAFLTTTLRMQGILAVDLDGTLQTVLMIMFFTTIGMGASLILLKKAVSL